MCSRSSRSCATPMAHAAGCAVASGGEVAFIERCGHHTQHFGSESLTVTQRARFSAVVWSLNMTIVMTMPHEEDSGCSVEGVSWRRWA